MLSKDLKIKIIVEKIGMITWEQKSGDWKTALAYLHGFGPDNELYLFIEADENKEISFSKNAVMSLTIQNFSNHFYIGLIGNSKLINDKDFYEEQWDEVIENWFPKKKKKDAPLLLSFDTDQVDYLRDHGS